MGCKEIQSRLTAYAAGELAQGERSQLEGHLRQCVRCRFVLARVDPLAACLLDTPALPPDPVGLTGRILAAAQERRQTSAPSRWDLASWWRRTLSPAHALAAAVFVTGLVAGLSMGSTIISIEGPDVSSPAAVQMDPLNIYSLDALSDAPGNSLAGLYIALAAGSHQEAH